MSKMESAEEIGVRVENLIHQVDHLSDKAESLISLDAEEQRESPFTDPKTLDTLFVDDTANEFRPLPQTSNSRNNSDSEDHQDENGSDVAVKSAEESKLSKNSDVKVIMSDVSESGQNHSTQQSLNMETSGLRVRSHKAENGDKTASTDVHITSANTSQSSIPQKNQTNLSEDRLEKTDSLSRKVNRALAQNVTTPLSLSALDSIEVKSVSSTNSSKFALESERFQQSSLWQFVKRYIPESEQHKVKTKMVTDLSGQSTDLSSMSSNNSNLHGKNLKVNASGKSVLSEQRFNDGLVYSPVGSHKSSTPDHSFISGWKYTRDSEFINGNIRVAESDSDQKTNSSRDLKTSKGPSEQSSQLSHSADELSERVRKLLRQIDNSLEEKSNTDDTKEHPIVIPKLKGLEEVSGHVEHLELNTSQVTGTPRSIEDLTSDERFGSFMPNHSPNKPFSQLQRPIIPEEDEENNEFHETFESSLEEGEIREDSLPYILEARQPIDNRIIRDQIKDELRTSRLREELEMEQIEVRLQLDNENDTHNTQSTSGLKSDDAIPPDFPDHAFGSRDTTLEKNKSSTKLYYKAPKEPVVKEAWRQVTPQPTPDTTIIEPVHPPSQALHKSVRVVDATTAPPSHIASVIIQEDKTLLDSIRVVNDTQCSTSSSTIEWYPRNMKEFKALPKEQKIDFLKKLKAASKRRRSESISSSAASSKTALSTTTEEKMTQKIITAIDSNVRKTIQAEIQKFKNTIPDTQRPAGNPAKRPITEGDKENEPIHTKPSAKASASLRSPSQLTLHDIEDEIKEYKSKERITEKVEEEKKELKKNCAFMVSFGTQVEEQNINVEIRQLHRKTHKNSNTAIGKTSHGTQTMTAPVKRSNAWYCPIFTDRKVPIDRNALDSTKRLAENAWQKASLQEAVLIHKTEFISKSRARVRHVKLRREQRIIEKELEDERQKLFGTYTERQRFAKIHPFADKHHLGEKRPVNLKEARQETSKKYNQLPEVVEARKHEKNNREKIENQIKVKCYNRKIQSKVLSKL